MYTLTDPSRVDILIHNKFWIYLVSRGIFYPIYAEGKKISVDFNLFNAFASQKFI